MGDGPSQRVPLWSQLPIWQQPEFEGRYHWQDGIGGCSVCTLCGALVSGKFMASHDAYHEEQGY